jgi:succinoglycan biosynthesis transport protein ExoP
MAIEVHSGPRMGYEPIRRPPVDAGGEDLDWLGLGRTLWRRKLFVFGFVVIVLGLCAAYVSQIPPSFEAEALVKLNDRETRIVTDFDDVLQGRVANEQQGVQGELLVITSRNMAERMVDELHLHLLPEFNPALQPKSSSLVELLDPSKLVPFWVLDYLPKAWAETLMTPNLDAEMTDQRKAALLRSTIVETVLDNIKAEGADGSTVLRLSFISTDADLARIGADTLARLYLVEQLEMKQSASLRAREFLNNEIERLRASVAAAEQAIQDYRRSAGLSGIEPDEQQLAGLTTEKIRAQSERAEAEARLRQIQRLMGSDADLDQAAQLLDSPTLTTLRGRELELNRELAELSQEYGERHPRMRNLREQMITVEERRRLEIRQIAQRQRDEVAVLLSRERQLVANIDEIKLTLGQLNEAEIELEALEREALSERELLETYLNRVKEITSQAKAQQPDARIISRAVLPQDPTYPKRALIFGVAGFAAMLLGSLAVFGLERLDNTFRSSEQIEELVGLATLGLVPAITGLDKRHGRPQDYVLDNPNSPFGEAVRSLRTGMLLTSAAGTPPRSILMTSSIPNEGKTSLAMCLARVHARSGRRTLIIDCDLRRPRLHELTGVANQSGLSDLLLNHHELDEVLHTDERSGAAFVSAGPPVPDPAALLASERMQKLLKSLTSQYDLVILDSPPVLSVSDARVLSQLADKTVFLVHWGSTKRTDVMMGVKQLIEAGADMAGLVLSRVNVRKHARYGYRDSGYYYDDKYTKYYHSG